MASVSSIENHFLEQMKASGQYVSESLSEMEISEEILNAIPREIIVEHHLFPLKKENDVLVLVTDTPQSLKQKAAIQRKLNFPIRLVLAGEEIELAELIRVIGKED